jgi:CubicO group peptidase (beta-lactamase class C family)
MTSDFDALHLAMRAEVDQQFLPGVSTALMRGREVVDLFCYGFADKEAGIPLREDHIFRVFSNTKLLTSCALMMLWEEGRIRLDDPIEIYLPELARRQVLRPGATRLDDTEPAKSSITVRHLMTHTSGLSYGVFDPGSLQYTAYNELGVMNPTKTLADMVTTLSVLPLSFHPGTRWEYSVATDVIARLIEVVSGKTFGEVLSSRIFEPLGMVDTDFWVPESKRNRLCALYVGANLMDPTKPGLVRADSTPYPDAYLRKPARESGGGGLVSTLGDTIRLIQSLLRDGQSLLKAETIDLMFQNQLPPGICVQFPNFPPLRHLGFGLGSAVAIDRAASEPTDVINEVNWGGLAGTVWWINPRIRVAGILMTQRYFGFGNPYMYRFKREAYKALAF